tara:strand:+ start:158 stop:337 length:180 start_codon:yes stop_codon:yes gene_type:complete
MLRKRLTRHLEEESIGYFGHFRRAARISILCAAAAIFCAVHAIFPFLFERRASKILEII